MAEIPFETGEDRTRIYGNALSMVYIPEYQKKPFVCGLHAMNLGVDFDDLGTITDNCSDLIIFMLAKIFEDKHLLPVISGAYAVLDDMAYLNERKTTELTEEDLGSIVVRENVLEYGMTVEEDYRKEFEKIMPNLVLRDYVLVGKRDVKITKCGNDIFLYHKPHGKGQRMMLRLYPVGRPYSFLLCNKKKKLYFKMLKALITATPDILVRIK